MNLACIFRATRFTALDAGLFQQGFHDAQPFRIERIPRYRVGGSTIPILRVMLIAFLAMEVGMNPGTCRPLILLSRLMGANPIALGIPPEAGQGWRKFCGRLRFGQ